MCDLKFGNSNSKFGPLQCRSKWCKTILLQCKFIKVMYSYGANRNFFSYPSYHDNIQITFLSKSEPGGTLTFGPYQRLKWQNFPKFLVKGSKNSKKSTLTDTIFLIFHEFGTLSETDLGFVGFWIPSETFKLQKRYPYQRHVPVPNFA